jgi:hypothetical protein
MRKDVSRDIEIVEMYKSGKTYADISRHFGFKSNVPMILTALKRNGIDTGLGRYPDRAKNSKNIDLDFFENIDTKEKAYVLGLIYSDGSIDKDGYGFSFVSKDFEQVELVKRLLKSEHKICKVSSYDNRTLKTYTRYTIHICSKKITKDLFNIGLHSSKSFNCNFPNISIGFIWHFIRGLFDGDGCIYKSTSKEGQLSFSIILSGQLKDGVKKFFNDSDMSLTSDQIKHKNENGIISSLKYSSYKDLKFIYENMYNESDSLRLERKYTIFSTLREYKRGVYCRKSRKVYQYDVDNNLIKVYNSIKDINGFNQSKIYQSIRKNKLYRKYLFKYE